jgi:hypothetical protein
VIIGHDWGSVAACGAGMLEPERMARLVCQKLITDWDQMKRSWYMWYFQPPGIYEMAISADDCATRASRACRDGATGRGTTSNAARCSERTRRAASRVGA